MKLSDLPPLPSSSGVYIFRRGGVPLYIGKANVLTVRVVQHFKAGGKSARFTALADELEFIVTRGPTEALVLESNLIKAHRPHYNVLLKDGKHYPWLKLTRERFPMLIVTRQKIPDGGEYFGPYPDSGAVWRVKRLLDESFQLRKNSGLPLKKRTRPCLNFHLGRCLGPCVDRADEAEYGAVVAEVRAVLGGQADHLFAKLENGMKKAAARQDFETAATLRDRLAAAKRLFGQEQHVLLQSDDSFDVLGLAHEGAWATVQLFKVRAGRVVGREKRLLAGEELEAPEVLHAFLSDHQPTQGSLLLPFLPDGPASWESVLGERLGARVRLHVPARGQKRRLLEMAQSNAREGLASELLRQERLGQHPALQALAQRLDLPEPPQRIEAFDNSNLFGTHIVSAMSVIENGRPKKADYRRFRVRGLDQPDDYESMRQTLYRRFAGSLSRSLPLPDLLLIDGGAGQVSAALEVLQALDLQIPMLGLAKREETLVFASERGACWWKDGEKSFAGTELSLPHTDPGLRLLIFARDEVHRFALGYNRELRQKAAFKELFEDVRGIGPKKLALLRENFAGPQAVIEAGEEKVAALVGKNAAAAVLAKAEAQLRRIAALDARD